MTKPEKIKDLVSDMNPSQRVVYSRLIENLPDKDHELLETLFAMHVLGKPINERREAVYEYLDLIGEFS